jgi:hypothetical protein
MDISSQVVPAIIILIANLLSGKQSSLRWESVTAIFGWGAAVGIVSVIVLSVIYPNSEAGMYAIQISGFCLLTALARDYEKILHPLMPWNKK